jgi:hypothetical protein
MDTVNRHSMQDVPWQVWVVVGMLVLEGSSNLLQIPSNAWAIEWLLAKCLFVAGLINGWRWVFILFQVIATIHVVGFLVPAPFVAFLNLLTIVLTCSAFRFYFPASTKPETV